MIVVYICLVFYLIMPKLGSIDLSVLFLLISFIFVFIRNRVKVYGSDDVDIYQSGLLKKTHVNLYLLMLLLFSLSILSFILNQAGDVDFQFLLKPIRVIIISFLILYIAKSQFFTLKDVALIILISATTNSLVVFSQYLFQVFLGVSDFLLNPNFSEAVVTPYRKPGLMSGYPTAGIFSIFGVLSSIYLYSISRISKLMFILIFIINGAACFMTARTAVYLFFLFCLPYFFVSIVRKRGYVTLAIMSLLVAFAVSYVASSNDKVLLGTVDKMFANIINLTQKGTFNDYSTEDLIENHYELPDEQFTFIFGNSKPSNESEVNSDVSIFKITWNSGFIAALIYIFAYLYMWLSASSKCHDKADKLYVGMFFLVFFIANAKGFYFFSRVIGDSSMLLWCVATSNFKRVEHNET